MNEGFPSNWEEWLAVLNFLIPAIGILGVEYLYCTSADEVRLLYVLLLIPAGAIVGYLVLALVTLLAGVSVVLAVAMLAFMAIAIVFAGIGAAIEFLHDTVLWEN